MVKESMLTKEEKQWLKVSDQRSFTCGTFNHLTCPLSQDHNKKCLERLEPYLKDDKRAIKWLKRESDRGIGIAAPGPGGITIDWD